jgi:hypothetical protein
MGGSKRSLPGGVVTPLGYTQGPGSVPTGRTAQPRELKPPTFDPGKMHADAAKAAGRTRRRAIGDGRRQTLLGSLEAPTTTKPTLLGGGY